MLVAELKTRPSLVLSESTEIKYTLYASTKKEVNELQELLQLHPDTPDERYLNHDILLSIDTEIDMIGHISEVKGTHVQNLIKNSRNHTIKGVEYGEKDEVIEEYTCYQEHKKASANNNVIKHEEKLSSFHCACELMNAKYFIVLKQKLKV